MRKFIDQPMTIAFEKNFPEVILAITTIMYSIMLILPPDSFLYAQGHTLMANYAPTWAWGVIFLTLGLTNMFGILRRHGDMVRHTARALSFAWFATAFLFLISSPAGPGWIFILCLAFLYGGTGTEYRIKTKWHGEFDPHEPGS